MLIKTMNRYMANPAMFIKNSGGVGDLVSLNNDFKNPQLVSNLFRTGTAAYTKTSEYLFFIFSKILGREDASNFGNFWATHTRTLRNRTIWATISRCRTPISE